MVRTGKHIRRGVALIAVLSCGVSRPWDLSPRPIGNLPDRFVESGSSTSSTSGGQQRSGCAGRLLDPRDNTQLTLVRSTRREGTSVVYWGDYSVAPGGRIRLGATELLRIDCGSGRPLGQVARGA